MAKYTKSGRKTLRKTAVVSYAAGVGSVYAYQHRSTIKQHAQVFHNTHKHIYQKSGGNLNG